MVSLPKRNCRSAGTANIAKHNGPFEFVDTYEDDGKRISLER